MCRVQFEDRLHLIRRERGQIGQPFACQFYDGFDVGLACDAFIDRAGARADVISQANKNLVNRAPCQGFQIEGTQSLADATRLRVGQKAEEPRTGSPRRAHALGGLSRSAG